MLLTDVFDIPCPRMSTTVESGEQRRVPLWLDEDRSAQLPPVRVPRRLLRELDGRARLNGRSRAGEVRLALGVWAESGGFPPAGGEQGGLRAS